jgi:Tfp pilus assembly protein PilN
VRHVNLLPAEYQERSWFAREDGGPETTKRILGLAGALTALLAIVLSGLYLQQRSVVNSRRDTLSGLQDQVVVANAKAAQARADQAIVQTRLAAVQSVASQRVAWNKALIQLGQFLPRDVLLTSLQLQAPVAGAVAGVTAAPTTGAAPSGFSVTGVTTSQRAVANVLDRLALLPWLSDVTLQSSSRSASTSGGGGVQFSIGANTRQVGAQP